jgi:hypothetical protein|tara:strand:- start:162 stop:458 length:297 start_codon:yes stop_codon:yes gene_type:complete
MLITHLLRNNDNYVSLLGDKINIRMTYSAWQKFIGSKKDMHLPFNLKIVDKLLEDPRDFLIFDKALGPYLNVSNPKALEYSPYFFEDDDDWDYNGKSN